MMSPDHGHRIPTAAVICEEVHQLEMLSGFLRDAGLEPCGYSNAEAALRAMSAPPAVTGGGSLPALLVVDLHLTGIDGWRFCHLLRSPEYSPLSRIPILLISATFSGDEVSRIAADLGIEGFLSLPLDKHRFGERVQAILAEQQMRTLLRVLIVDDNPVLVEALKEVFQNQGYLADTALTCGAATELIKNTAYNVAVLDYQLPDGCGDALLDTIRMHQPDCVSLMMTGNADPNRVLDWMKRGAAAYLRKPFKTEYLIDLCARTRRERTLLRVADSLELRTRELRESNELLSLFMRHSPFYAFIKEVTCNESKVLKASENFKDMIGICGQAMEGKSMGQIFPSEFAGKISADDWSVVSKGAVLKFEEDFNGRSYTTIKYPIVQEGRHLLAGYTIDITDRKRMEAEKEKLEIQNRLLQKSESLGRMAGAVAHHFNNQLQIVTMNLAFARSCQSDREDGTEHLGDAMKAVSKAAAVSSSMLTYLGQAPCKLDVFDLSDACQQHLPLLRAAMPANAILKIDLPVDGPLVRADVSQIQQILSNLVTNAWEACGGAQVAITLHVKTVAMGEVPVGNRFPVDFQLQDATYACLEVGDTGCGIEPGNIEKLFEPFFSSKFAGRGLGLPTVLGILRAHHGLITVESRPGQGSVFRAFLPISQPSSLQKPTVPTGAFPRMGRDRTVLVVDDEVSLVKLVAKAMMRMGFSALTAHDGAEAVEMFRRKRDDICLVISDLVMPKMDGWQTLAALRRIDPDIPVILSSGYSEAQVMAEDHSDLPQAFLSKPYNFNQLVEVVSRVLSLKSA
jgi:DNA-binding NtrC family response regulator/signal transduction histidine kinase